MNTFSTLKLKDKIVVITGASSGIGKACALVFAKHCAGIVMVGRDSAKLLQAELEVKKINANTITAVADVSKPEDCKKVVDDTLSAFGKISILINNAGLSMRALFEDVDLEVMHKLMNVNFWGAVYCTKYALPHILKEKGSVIGISSIAGKKGLPGRSGYSSSKFALEGFLETLRTENLKKDLHVLVACPGYTESNIRNTALAKDGKEQNESPLDESKLMKAEEVAGHIYQSVVSRKRDLVLTSNGKLTIWLNKFFPSMMDKMVYNFVAKEPGSPFK